MIKKKKRKKNSLLNFLLSASKVNAFRSSSIRPRERKRREDKKKKKEENRAKEKTERTESQMCDTHPIHVTRLYCYIYTCFHLKPYNITIARFYLKKKRKKKGEESLRARSIR